MANKTRRVGRPRKRSEGPGDYVGFRAPRELKERLEMAAARNGRSLSTEAQIRLEKSFEKQELLGEALELAYGRRLAGILFLLGDLMHRAGILAGFTSKGSIEGMYWFDDPFAYDQVVTVASTILEAFRPPGDPNVLQKNGEHPRSELSDFLLPARRAVRVLVGLRNSEAFDARAKETEPSSLRSMLLAEFRIEPEREEYAKRMLGPLIERLPLIVPDQKNA